MLKTLSQSQSECVKTIDGPVMVLAGPGTGKTFTVIQRLSEMLLTHKIAPESILCLTFSDTAAKEMQERLSKEVGEVANSVTIGTYHAFCQDVIKKNPKYFEMAEGVDLIDDVIAFRIMRDIFEEMQPQFLRTEKGDFYHYIPKIGDAVGEIKKTRTTKEKYFENLEDGENFGGGLRNALQDKEDREFAGKKVTKKLLGEIEAFEKNINRAKEIWQIYEQYTNRLKASNYIDFDDMINFVLDVFDANPDFLCQVASKYKYFLVDEYQDTNFAQNQVVFKLAEGSSFDNVFVVGDDDQIIYGFQGAQSDNLEKFLRRFPGAKVICLQNNFRSSQNILDFSYQLISQDDSRIEFNPEFSQYGISKKLTAKNEKLPNNPIRLLGFDADFQEKDFIVNEVENLVNSERCPVEESVKNLSEIAILVKKNDDAKDYLHLLQSRGIPAQLKKNKTIFEVESSILVLFYLKALADSDFHSDKLFGLVLAPPFGFAPQDYAFLLDQNRAAEHGQSFVETIRQNPSYTWQNPAVVKKFLTVFDVLKEEVSDFNLKKLVEDLISKTGIFDFYDRSEINRRENLQALATITDEAAKFQKTMKSGSLGDFLEHIDIAYELKKGFEVSGDYVRENAVQLMTLHGSKGREFQYVYMPGLISKNWEKYRNAEKIKLPVERVFFEPKSEHLRLLFVGLTRAKHSLCLSFPKAVDDKVLILTDYISSVAKENPLVDFQNIELEDNATEDREEALVPVVFECQKYFCSQTLDALQKLHLSHSSMDLYSKCSRAFLYKHIYKIAVRDVDTKELDFGNAIHRALEVAADYAKKNGVYPDLAEMVETFEKEFVGRFCRNSDAESEERAKRRDIVKEILLARGKRALAHYYSYFTAIFPKNIFSAEYRVASVDVDEMKLTGIIDRIEKNDDGTYSLTDYKTGRSYTFGKAYEKYLNQVQFYKLLFETQNPDAKVSQVEICYVEDPEKSYVQGVCDNDNHEITEKIKEVYDRIHNFEFAPVCPQQKNDACAWCNYKQLCKLNVI